MDFFQIQSQTFLNIDLFIKNTYARTHVHPDIFYKPLFWTMHTILSVLAWKPRNFFSLCKQSFLYEEANGYF